MHRPHPKDTAAADESVSHGAVNQSPEEILEYWTPERMEKARPREIRIPYKESNSKETGQGSEGK
ncbi:hypothetical protein [Pseudarthrobacter sp. N5]|uniref:hypothetical protein n=1 Tax=Pseudarthrobacter sp. N5 TaxID=3418416 RepID=UPI003CF7933C